MELAFIEYLRNKPETTLLGDDAAVVGQTLYTVDMLTEGVDFLLDQVTPEKIGRKALAVNLSDIAAMGGVPTDYLVSVALPQNNHSLDLAKRLYAGMLPLAEKYGVRIIGGDTNSWNGGLVISVTVIGAVSKYGVIRRGGGKPNDRLLVTGPLGGSLLDHQFSFEPRIFEAEYLLKHFSISAGLDISDGLSLDLARLTRESHLGATLIAEQIPIAEDARTLANQTGMTPLTHALSDGEDFELLLAVPSEVAQKLVVEQPLRPLCGVTLYDIGFLTDTPGLRILENGQKSVLVPKGFVHE